MGALAQVLAPKTVLMHMFWVIRGHLRLFWLPRGHFGTGFGYHVGSSAQLLHPKTVLLQMFWLISGLFHQVLALKHALWPRFWLIFYLIRGHLSIFWLIKGQLAQIWDPKIFLLHMFWVITGHLRLGSQKCTLVHVLAPKIVLFTHFRLLEGT